MAKSKEAFFTELARLGSLTDDSERTDDEDFARLISGSGSKRAKNHDAVASASNVNANVKGIPRTFSEPQSSPPRSGREGQAQVSNIPSMKRANTTGTLSEGKKAEGPVKRRRTCTPRTISEERQIFKGLVFC